MMAMTTVFRVCPFCGEPNTVQVDEDKYTEYINGDKNIQNVFPELTPDERECILTGYHPKCWDEMWEDIKMKRVMKEGEGMKKSAILFFHTGNAVQRSCDGIEIVPGEVHLMNEQGEVLECYKSAYIKAFCYDGKEFPLIPINRKEKIK